MVSLGYLVRLSLCGKNGVGEGTDTVTLVVWYVLPSCNTYHFFSCLWLCGDIGGPLNLRGENIDVLLKRGVRQDVRPYLTYPECVGFFSFTFCLWLGSPSCFCVSVECSVMPYTLYSHSICWYCSLDVRALAVKFCRKWDAFGCCTPDCCEASRRRRVSW